MPSPAAAWHHARVTPVQKKKKAAPPRAKTTAKTTTKAKAKPKRVAKKPAAKSKALARKKPPTRADLGAPIDGFFAKQPAALRPILEELRALVEAEVPEAESSIKWGMPFYTLGGAMMCALGGHKSHVNLILAGPPDAFDDPEGRLTGEGKTGRHLKLTSLDQFPREAVRGWIRTASAIARKKP
jgi:hypothetical protein